jgi:Swt1-like HEPN
MKDNDAKNLMRSFGMSGYLVSEELRGIESKFHLDLGHTQKKNSEAERVYYPQFEQEVRAEAAAMAIHYEAFYCLEKSIRKLITETLSDADPADWWKNKVPQAVIESAQHLIQKEIDGGITRRSEDQLDYTTFGELAVIITSNWAIFGTIFTSRRAVEKVMASLNILRGPIAHCSPMTDDEIDRLSLTVKDWFRIMA